jgi:hypothetical protein
MAAACGKVLSDSLTRPHAGGVPKAGTAFRGRGLCRAIRASDAEKPATWIFEARHVIPAPGRAPFKAEMPLSSRQACDAEATLERHEEVGGSPRVDAAPVR